MIEIIKELASVLKELPDLAIYIMVGVLFYKVFIIGGAFSLVKYIVNKLHDYLTQPKKVIKQIEFDDVVYSHNGAINDLKSFLIYIKSFRGGHNLSPEHIDFLKEAWSEKITKENIVTPTDLFSFCKKYKR